MSPIKSRDARAELAKHVPEHLLEKLDGGIKSVFTEGYLIGYDEGVKDGMRMSYSRGREMETAEREPGAAHPEAGSESRQPAPHADRCWPCNGTGYVCEYQDGIPGREWCRACGGSGLA